MNPESQLQIRTPVAVIRLTEFAIDGYEHAVSAEFTAPLLDRPGFFRLPADLFVVTPTPGNEAVFDTAVRLVQELTDPNRGSRERERRLSAVVFPGVAVLSKEGTSLLDDPLIEDLRQKSPSCGPGVFLSGRASKMLELTRQLEPAPQYRGPSGLAMTLFRVGELQLDNRPWRNPVLLDHASGYIAPGLLQEAADRLATDPVLRITGPLGCGKTRSVWELLGRSSTLRIWLRAGPEASSVIPLAEQLARQILRPSKRQTSDVLHPFLAEPGRWQAVRESIADSGRSRGGSESVFEESVAGILEDLCSKVSGRVAIVVDDFHLAEDRDAKFVSTLLSAHQLGDRLATFLVGRSGGQHEQLVESSAKIELPRLTSEEMRRLAATMTEGLSIPEHILERFADSVEGSPFAFEECLFGLVHERTLRRVYGSFFFGGDEKTSFAASQRYVRHLESEVARLGPPLPIRLLALAELSVPATELAATASILNQRVEPEWERSFLESGLVERTTSPWGDGVRLVSPVDSKALAEAPTEDSAASARHQLGELLALSGQGGEAHWQAYRLLAGTPDAIEPLLQVFKTPFASSVPREELLAALETELQLTRHREDSERAELDILWRLVPLARRMGCLARFETDLERGIELAHLEPSRLLALASVKAEVEQSAGEYVQAEATIRSALKSAEDVDVRRKALLMVQLGRLLLQQNRFVDAEQLFTSLHSAFGKSGSSALVATCLFHLGNIALHTGQLDEAMAKHEQALAMRQEWDLPQAVGSSLSALGTVAGAIGNYPEALQYYRKAEAVLKRKGLEGEVAFALLGVARMLSRIGDFTSASGPARKALELRQGRDDSTGEAIARLAVARNYLDLGRPDAALEEARKAHFQLSLVSAEGPLAEADEILGQVHLRSRRPGDARRHLESALSRYRARQDAQGTAFAIASLIETCLSQEDADGVRRYTVALQQSLSELPPADLRELLYFRVFGGLDWLKQQGEGSPDPSPFLQKAYRSVLRKAEHLDHESRQQYLFRVPVIRQIVETATRRGLDERRGRAQDTKP